MSKPALVQIPHDRILDIWPLIEHRVGRGVRNTGGRYTVEALRRKLLARDWQLWLVWRPGGASRTGAVLAVVVTELYRLVTFDAGTTPDWDRVRALFLDEAVIVLRTSREATTVFSVDGFVDDFVAFAGREDVQASGFVERIVRRKSTVFGDIAHVLVLYEAEISGTERPPQQGVDSFELIRRDGRWSIAAVLNEIPTPERPVPPELRESLGV